MLPLVHLLSAAIYLVAYSIATIVAYLDNAHHDMWPIYLAITIAAVLHAVVILVHQFRRRRTPDDTTPPEMIDVPEGDDDVTYKGNKSLKRFEAGIPDARRITYYDNRGLPYFTEWELQPTFEPTPDAGDEEVTATDAGGTTTATARPTDAGT